MNKTVLARLRPLFGLLILIVIVAAINRNFLSVGNLLNVLRQTSINAIIATGMTFVILSGGIDLSVGSVLAYSGAMVAFLLNGDMPIPFAMAITLALGAALGSCTGFIIQKGGVQPFIATFVSMSLLRGATLVFTDGKPFPAGKDALADAFAQVGQGYLLGIPVPVFIMAGVVALAYYVLRHTRFGRYVYALGGNEKAAFLSGIRVDVVKIAIYGICGMLASLAGIVLTARLSSAQPTAGTGYELDAIAAVVIGGTSLSGGAGSILGTLVGALIIGVLNNALNLLEVSSYYQTIAKGLVILVAVLMDRRKK